MAGNDPAQPRVEVEVASRISAEVTIASSASDPGITFGAEIVRIVDGEESADKISFETGELDENQTCSWWTESLQPSNTYIARTFITNGRNRKYSERKTFTTPSTSKPTVSAVTLEGENLVASVLDNGGRSIEDVGFVAGDTPDRKSLMRAEKIPAIEEENGRFSLPLSILTGGKTYYVIAYAIDDNEDVGYGAAPLEVYISKPSQTDDAKHERYLTFTSEGTTKISLSNTSEKNLKFYYSYNAEEWIQWDYKDLAFSSFRPLFLCGDNPGGINISSSPEEASFFVSAGNLFSVTGDIMSLLSSTEELTEIPAPYCFASLFRECTNLAIGPELPATMLMQRCYDSLFWGCTNLKAGPQLPATVLSEGCYSSMFRECSFLEKAPNLPAMLLASHCYEEMFYGCWELKNTPELPATTLAESCYSGMFRACGGLTVAPKLPATVLVAECYRTMFMECVNLVKAPELPATVLAYGCYSNMFKGCLSLTQAPELPATSLAPFCYSYMFSDCVVLEKAPELSATVLSEWCYSDMFVGCTFPKAPELPAASLAPYCYNGMFYGCSELTEAPKIPATKLAQGCYRYMFHGCSKLTDAPELPATQLEGSCYENMFKDCTSLTTAPQLPAVVLYDWCYSGMFEGCKNLRVAPELPAQDLERGCYENMFSGCDNLENAPELPAATLSPRCYRNMFSGCSNLQNVKCLANDISEWDCTSEWLYGVSPSGTFVKAEGMEDWPTGVDGIPEGWTVVSE